MTRNSLFGRSTSLTCLTATVSPVPIFKARKTEPKAPFPRQSPSCCLPLESHRWTQSSTVTTYIVLESCDILAGLGLHNLFIVPLCRTHMLGLVLAFLQRRFDWGPRAIATIDLRPSLQTLGSPRHDFVPVHKSGCGGEVVSIACLMNEKTEDKYG